MRIGIANDLPMAVEVLRRSLALMPDYHVIWIAKNGAEAVAMCARETPDLVLMDLLMPEMDGVEATRRIMNATPCPILVVTASVGANTSRVYEAMGCGALDAVDTPTLGSGDPRGGSAMFLAKIDVIGKLIGEGKGRRLAAENLRADESVHSQRRLLAIGASAGGPAAVAAVLGALPRDFPAAVVVVQHIDGKFANGMAEWLNEKSKFPVRVAKEGDIPNPGNVLLAGTDDHLTFLTADRLGYTPEPRDYVYRPSVDVFFRSVGKLWLGEVAGVLLTGMGRDGALGLKELRARGHYTIAQDEATSVVYGMPRAAAAMGAAVDILPLERIAPKLVETFGRKLQRNGARP